MIDTMMQQAIGGLFSSLFAEFTKPANMQLISDSILQPQASAHCKHTADPAIAALKAYKNGVMSRDQALRIVAIALEDQGKTIDVESIALLEKLFN